jgi:hypothetical protein
MPGSLGPRDGPRIDEKGSLLFWLRVEQRKHLQVSTAHNGDSITFLYVCDVRTSQETRLRSPWAVTELGLRSICRLFSYLTENTHGPPRPVTGDSITSLYSCDIRTSQETHLYVSTACYG